MVITSHQKLTIHSFSVKKSQCSAADLSSSNPTLQLTPDPIAVAFHFLRISPDGERHEPTSDVAAPSFRKVSQ